MADVFELHELAIRSLGVSTTDASACFYFKREEEPLKSSSKKEKEKKKTFTIFLSWHFFCSSWFQGLRWVPLTVYCKKLTSKYLLVLWGWPDFDWEGKYGFSVPRMRYIHCINYLLTYFYKIRRFFSNRYVLWPFQNI